MQESCLPEGSTPPSAYYSDTTTPFTNQADTVYSPCDEVCISCTGPSSSDCQRCRTAYESSSNGQITQCVSSCSQSSNPSNCQSCHPQCNGCFGSGNEHCVSCVENSISINGDRVCVPFCGDGTYLSRLSTSTFEHECQMCHPLCQNCTGPTNQDCVPCVGASIVVDGKTTCVPECNDGQYLERVSAVTSEYQCQSCNSLCLTCNGPQNTNCISCTSVNYTTNGVSTCLTSCPTGTYESSPGRLCLTCHDQCSGGCSGPTNRNCSSCLETTITISSNVFECSPFTSCSFGMEYNAMSSTCTFSQ